jgi:integrase
VEEQRKLEAAAKASGGNDQVSILLCLYTALRIGEVCALQWDDVDLDTGMLHVRQTLQRVRVAEAGPGAPKTRLMFLPPKTESSVRSIPLPPVLVALLRRHKGTGNSKFVLSCEGGPMEPRTLQYHFKKLLAQAGLRDVNFHTTRHTFVARALEHDMDVKTISEILGHASPVFTMKRYAHSHEEHKRKKLEERANSLLAPDL